MEIKDWKYEDLVTGITFMFIEGKTLNRLHLEGNLGNVNNRDFYFTKDGKFDGTGSAIQDKKGNLKREINQ